MTRLHALIVTTQQRTLRISIQSDGITGCEQRLNLVQVRFSLTELLDNVIQKCMLLHADKLLDVLNCGEHKFTDKSKKSTKPPLDGVKALSKLRSARS